MGRKKLPYEVCSTTFRVTDEDIQNIKSIGSRSFSWRNKLSDASKVVRFCISFVFNNLDAVEYVMKEKSDVGPENQL